jgi:hypothetical protein
LLREAVAYFGLRVSLLNLLLQAAALVRDFYQKLGHLRYFLKAFSAGLTASV